MIRNSPLIERLSRLHESRMSGRLALRGASDEVTIHLYDGFIDAVASSDEQQRLGQALVREGLVDDRVLVRMLARADKKDVHLGALAVEEGLLTAALLAEILATEASQKLLRAVDEKWALDSFDQEAEQFQFPLRLTPQQLILDIVRRNGVSFESRSGESLGLVGEADLSAVRWSPRELAILTRLHSSLTLEELVASTQFEELEIRKTLRAVDELGALDRQADNTGAHSTALAPVDLVSLERLVPRETRLALNEKVELASLGNPIVGEYFKSLKVRLDEYTAETGASIFSISSPHVEDGKSLISANLSLCLGEDPNRKVLLLDCDLRRPSVHRQFGISIGPGLADHLVDEALPPHCYVRRVGNIFVMTAGQIADNPIALFSLTRMKDLMKYVKNEFDTVIVDSPPLMPISDARVISSLCEATMLVVRRGKTPFGAIERSLKSLDPRRFVGVILNEVQPSRFSSGYYSYAYSYSPYAEVDSSREGIVELKSGSYDWTDVTRPRKKRRR